jgi:cytochrome b561
MVGDGNTADTASRPHHACKMGLASTTRRQDVTIRWRNTETSWGAAARSLHWLVAVLILVQFVIGKVAEGMSLSPAKIDIFVWHKSLGVTVLLIVMLRLAWRLLDTPPTPPEGIPEKETKLAAIGHWLLYVLMIAVPVSGWWVSDASRVPFEAYFIVPVPDLIPTDRAIQETAATVHEVLTNALLGVAAVHVTAALWHHFRLRNDVLRRMLTGGRQR